MAQVKPGETLLILADTWTDIGVVTKISGRWAEGNGKVPTSPGFKPGSIHDTRRYLKWEFYDGGSGVRLSCGCWWRPSQVRIS
jgi:hypothetical protein